VKEPFNLSMAEIAQLTDYQLLHIYFRPDKQPPAREGKPYQQIFYETWRRRGLNQEQIREKWKEKQAKIREQNKARQKRPKRK